MSTTTTTEGEVYENGHQREEEALAVITENTETPAQEGADHTDGSADNQSKENNEHQDQEQHPQQQQNSDGDGAGSEEKQPKNGPENEEDQNKPKMTEDNQQESDIKAENTISVGTSTVLVETQEVVTSSTTSNQQQRKNSTGRIRSASRRASYQASRSYAGGSFQNYGLTYLPYKSNFEPSEDARRRADEFFKTLKL